MAKGISSTSNQDRQASQTIETKQIADCSYQQASSNMNNIAQQESGIRAA